MAATVRSGVAVGLRSCWPQHPRLRPSAPTPRPRPAGDQRAAATRHRLARQLAAEPASSRPADPAPEDIGQLGRRAGRRQKPWTHHMGGHQRCKHGRIDAQQDIMATMNPGLPLHPPQNTRRPLGQAHAGRWSATANNDGAIAVMRSKASTPAPRQPKKKPAVPAAATTATSCAGNTSSAAGWHRASSDQRSLPLNGYLQPVAASATSRPAWPVPQRLARTICGMLPLVRLAAATTHGRGLHGSVFVAF